MNGGNDAGSFEPALPPAVVAAYPCGILALDAHGIVRVANPAAAALLDRPLQDLVGRDLSQALATALTRENLPVPPSSWPWLPPGIRHPLIIGLLQTAGQRRWLEVTATPTGAGLTSVSMIDVTPYVEDGRRLERQALHDPLTGLPNRVLFADRLAQALRGARRERASLAVLMMDLNGFKDINDTFGHDTGDRLLQAVATRFRERLRASDTLARLGGDEFAMILPGDDAEGALAVAQSLVEALDTPVVLHEQRVPPLHLTTAVGIALYPRHGADADTLLRRADTAMYAAKRGGHGPAVYDGESTELARLDMALALRSAIAGRELALRYQPKIGLADAGTRAVEALVRWTSPAHGEVAPSVFMPLAEESGLMMDISAWVVDTALAHCAAWRAAGVEVRVDTNVAASLLRDPALAGMIDDALARHAIPARLLGIEVAEAAVMAERARGGTALQELAERGLTIAIDDYGAGYSSPAHLKTLPVKELQIDRGLVQDSGHNRTDGALMQALVAIGHALGLTVVAEGVEDAATWTALRKMGCDAAQGFYITAPLTADEVLPWIQARRRPRRQLGLFRKSTGLASSG